MTFFEELAKGGVAGIGAALGTFLKDVRTAITGQTAIDPNKQAELLLQAQAIEATMSQVAADFDKAQMEGQVAIAKLEAASQDKFVSRWRPFIGWVCGAAIGYEMIFRGILTWAMAQTALLMDRVPPPALPSADMGDMIVALLGMLGLGTMRSYDKRTRAGVK